MDMRRVVALLAEEAEQQIQEQVWQRTASERVLALEAGTRLRDVVGPQDVQEALPQIERLERLRETLAVLAVSLARTHGRLAWFLSGAVNALEPVLRWRALPAGPGGTFGTVLASPEEYREAEDAVRRLREVLALIAQAGAPGGVCRGQESNGG
ncbi:MULTISPECIES: hypothetical protein [unclassified Streptomyces]|uniref:hypothetical protein n=1 Tax=unclassified Streptomyces TaxID=2593676 RepID=UPI002E374683|nr:MULTISPECIES: hypothetical protein [unclassified Streptomyces]WUC68433.1 hypothetical protein OG861_31700 [Streptomyces sp. NBC_00539]